MEAVFWTAVGLVLYNLVVFPVLVLALSRVVGREPRKDPRHQPRATVLITAYNEETHIRAKLENTLSLDYPPNAVEVLVALDGCTDRTAEIVRSFNDPRIRLLEYPRRGKTEVQNAAAEEATGEVIFFTDATALHNRKALLELVANCADPSVGCVTGRVGFKDISGSGSHGVKARLGYEHAVRHALARVYSMIGATGCIYAMPRSCVERVRDGLAHDFTAPALALMKGKRTVFEPKAEAYVERPLSDVDERTRRSRIAVHGLTAAFGTPGLLNPFRNPTLTFFTISMRVLKWFIPLFLIIALIANLLLVGRPIYNVTLAAQLTLYALALAGALWRRLGSPPRVLSVPFYFCLLNVSALTAIWKFIRGERFVTWEATSR